MHNRRFTRTMHMVAIYAVWYSFLRIHATLRVTPAMAAGLSQTAMDWAEIVQAMHADAPAKKRKDCRMNFVVNPPRRPVKRLTPGACLGAEADPGCTLSYNASDR
jgi:hypothetical protein